MSFETFYRLISYAVVLCGFLALWASGTFGMIVSGAFILALAGGWMLEGTRWQVSERLGTALIVLCLPAFYAAYQFRIVPLNGTENVVPAILSRMILTLSAIKILQKKSDRDWVFLYLMAFFEVLLAAGLSISLSYLASFLLFLGAAASAIIAFELRRAHARVQGRNGTGDEPARPTGPKVPRGWFSRLPLVASLLLTAIAVLAVPLFFVLPRVGGAGFGGDQSGLSTSSGFSDTVRLGGIGRIQQNDAIAMRVKIDGDATLRTNGYFRGVVLDEFDNVSWSKSRLIRRDPISKSEGDVIEVDPRPARMPVEQTIYLEPMDTPIIFAAPRAVNIEGGFPMVFRDAYGGLQFSRTYERTTYKVTSDSYRPAASELRGDDESYASDLTNYLQLPDDLDPRINELAAQQTVGLRTRYDKAVALERFLRSNFAYTLEQRAGGKQPVADFLFNVRAGHCEYFASALALMLRTQGVASRVATGFHGGDYNDASDVTVVRQRNAHAWVEVYFPESGQWIAFDPTPASDETLGGEFSGISGQISKYLDAIQTVWIQYFVAYDDEGQESMGSGLKATLARYESTITSYAQHSFSLGREWWSDLSGQRGLAASAAAGGYAAAFALSLGIAFLIVLLLLRVARRLRADRVHASTSVRFYSEMLEVLSQNGLTRDAAQTPLEFASIADSDDIAEITAAYHKVRFGGSELTETEANRIAAILNSLRRPHKKSPRTSRHAGRRSG